MQEFWNTGVLTAKTRCWAQGMDGWRPLQAIPQLKWCLLATGQAVMNESDLATLILNMLITMCSYYPSRCPSVCPLCLRITLNIYNLFNSPCTFPLSIHSPIRWTLSKTPYSTTNAYIFCMGGPRGN